MSSTIGTYYATVSAASFAIVVFGAALVGSRLISFAERAASLDRERGDFINQQISASPSPQATWAERGRRNELADLHVLVRRLQKTVVPPVLVALVTGVGSLIPLIGWLKDSAWLRVAVLVGLLVGSWLWIRLLWQTAADVLVITRAAYEQRAKERSEATKAGKPYLISGDPNALVGAFERLGITPGGAAWRQPIRRFNEWRLGRKLGDRDV